MSKPAIPSKPAIESNLDSVVRMFNAGDGKGPRPLTGEEFGKIIGQDILYRHIHALNHIADTLTVSDVARKTYPLHLVSNDVKIFITVGHGVLMEHPRYECPDNMGVIQTGGNLGYGRKIASFEALPDILGNILSTKAHLKQMFATFCGIPVAKYAGYSDVYESLQYHTPKHEIQSMRFEMYDDAPSHVCGAWDITKSLKHRTFTPVHFNYSLFSNKRPETLNPDYVDLPDIRASMLKRNDTTLGVINKIHGMYPNNICFVFVICCTGYEEGATPASMRRINERHVANPMFSPLETLGPIKAKEYLPPENPNKYHRWGEKRKSNFSHRALPATVVELPKGMVALFNNEGNFLGEVPGNSAPSFKKMVSKHKSRIPVTSRPHIRNNKTRREVPKRVTPKSKQVVLKL